MVLRSRLSYKEFLSCSISCSVKAESLINYLSAEEFIKGLIRGRHYLRSCIDFGRAEAPISAELSPQWFGRRNLYLWNIFTSAIHLFIVFLVPLVNNEIGLSLFSLLRIHIFTQ